MAVLPWLLYGSPPGDVATVLAFGREHQVGTQLRPPFAFWLTDVAFRLAGNHIFGVYLLAQLCFILTFWALFNLNRAIVGAQHAVLAVLLTATILLSFPGAEFRSARLARPLWTLVLLHAWQIVGQGRRDAWFMLPVDIGLLLLTTPASIPLLALLACLVLATPQGRRALMSADPLYALVILVVLVLPYAIWVLRAGVPVLPEWPVVTELQDKVLGWGLASRRAFCRGVGHRHSADREFAADGAQAENAPIIYRPPVDPFARLFVYVFALVPPVGLSFFAALFGRDQVVGGDGIALLLRGWR